LPGLPGDILVTAWTDSLDAVAREAAQCTACGLAAERTQVVPGEGRTPARLMLIGEGPGKQEDVEGRPFVGAAGQLLDRMLAAIRMSRQEVYIANVVKCRPPGNRTPTPEEADTCLPFLARQIALVNPEVIVALGATATRALLGTDAKITRLRGEWQSWGTRWIMPTYHPAFLLRDPRQKAVVWQDLQQVAERLGIDLSEDDG
jgi:uracil-DNA glycosylase family 4